VSHVFSLAIHKLKEGYKLLNLLTKCVFVSRDITFIEHFFLYNPTSDIFCMKPISSVTSSPLPVYEDFVIPAYSTRPE